MNSSLKSFITCRKRFVWALLIPILMIPFQNCSKGVALFTDKSLVSRLLFFEYHYTSATPIYFDAQAIPLAASGGNRIVHIMGTVAPSDGSSASVPIKIRVYDSAGNLNCPEITATIASGSVIFDQSCTMPDTALVYQIDFQVQFGGTWYDYPIQYSGF